MFEQLKDRFLKFFTYTAVTLILVGGAVFIWPQIERGRSLRHQDDALRERIEAKRRAIAEIKDCQHRFGCDSDFVELIARQNNRVFPGEIVFLFEKDK